ncbi:28S ribosomal protein S29, mitochondrial-like isoform X1 [Juglans microcarpa x Juglans regia]|uniref:28S ribosomal protein S29, mitochondrial-like isoform X1 n=1 Tax=Juglans microcarpa x Juglans regia TaxID=2249226 RepID=UPI001B7DE559|nr:28S ribosomal protein S29, mitochondrial-like isoform X1 [Juglans microcarpa x Juglans regia]
MLRCVLRASSAATSSTKSSPIQISAPHTYKSARNYSSKNTKSGLATSKKTNAKKSVSDPHASAADIKVDAALSDAQARARRLAADDKDQSLDVGPNGRPLFTTTPSLYLLSRKDTCSYLKFSIEGLKTVLPEGLPTGMLKEFDDSLRPALLVRQSFLDLRDNFRRIVDPPLFFSDANGPKLKKQIVLDGPASCGKSIALAMLVHWARDEGWLVFYIPRGREWTHGGFFSKNQQTGLWDTPLQAANVLKDFLKWNESHLKQLPCQIDDPIPLGEGAGVGWLKDVDNLAMPEGSTLCDLVNTGIKHTHAAVGVVVRLRRELSLVKNIPVLIAIDQYNSWFTFSEYEEAVTIRSSRPVHARELAMVNAFRSMVHDDMMVGAFSHSTAVGKLRKDLPDVPVDARVNFPRYSLDEAATVCHYYLRQRLVGHEAFSEENWKKVYYLSNGNGTEMRWLVPFMRQSA